jgi:hypothetical protein
MNNKFSAYLSNYNDFDMLEGALASIAGKVDELVVVDGAYEWMAPYYTALGYDPEKSSDRVFDIISASGMRYRVIRKIWKSEIEKRIAGFAACEGRYVYRIDSDEIAFLNDDLIDIFLREGKAVADVRAPQLVAPGWVFASEPVGRLGYLFDRTQIEPEAHLNYLWLVLTSDLRPAAGQPRHQSFEPAIGDIMHLTEWRTWRTAVNRAAFYHLNYMRGHGVHFIPELREKPLADLNLLFNVVPPELFRDMLLTSTIVTGAVEPPQGLQLLPVALSQPQQAIYEGYYNRFIAALAELNANYSAGETHFMSGQIMAFDLSSPKAREALIRDGAVTIDTTTKIIDARAKIDRLAPESGFSSSPVDYAIDGARLIVKADSSPAFHAPALRKQLQVQIWVDHSRTFDRFRVVT